MVFLLNILILCSIVLISFSLLPFLVQKIQSWQQHKEAVFAKEMDKMFYDKSPKNIVMLYFILPLIFGVGGYIILKSQIFMVLGILIGVIIPNFILKMKSKSEESEDNSSKENPNGWTFMEEKNKSA